jgi:AcrR family transcriptional regulator
VSSVQPTWPEPPALEIPPAPGSRRRWLTESWEERYKRCHLQLLEVAGRLANESGYDGTQIADIVAEASVSKRTFYEHFTSKDDCFAHLIRNARSAIIEAMIATAEHALPRGPFATFYGMLDAWKRHLATQPHLYEAMRNSQQEALDAEQRAGITQMAEVVAVAAMRLGSSDPLVELRRSSRFLTWGAFTMLTPILARGERSGEDISIMAIAMCRGFGLDENVAV